MERCGFFDANLVGEEYDRVYLASSFAAYFASFIGNGVFGGNSEELQVIAMATPQMQVTVETGQGWINGYWYENMSELYLPVDVADGVLNRIDSVVLRFGTAERSIWATVKKGTPAITPVAPGLLRNADYYELQLATISIPAGSLTIKQSQISDTRLNQAVCGLVMGLIQQFDTTAFGRQLQDFINNYIAQANSDYVTFSNGLESVKVLAQDSYQTFLTYIEGLKGNGNSAFADYLVWLGNLKTSATGEIQDLLDQLSDLVDTEVASTLDRRITDLEKLEPTIEVASINHNLNRYVDVLLYQLEYGAGVQLAGFGPAGGTKLTSVVCEYDLDDLNNVTVRTKQGFGTVEGVYKISDEKYAIVLDNSLLSLLITFGAAVGGSRSFS